MAEIEYSGIKFSGSKLLLLVPLLGAIGGAIWGGFEAYARYTAMEEKIDSYTAPDLSGIEQTLAVFEKENDAVEQIVGQFKDLLGDMRSDLSDMKLELKDDITEVFKNIDRQEGRNRNNVEDVRDLINAFELRVDNKVTKLDEQIDSLESKLDQRIKAALENPLAK
jgi:chromosome segregation ATPase|tara:strand:- start:3370 stop:3867 length:498 start_codon:yes stop_codon:yes gene_type:complete